MAGEQEESGGMSDMIQKFIANKDTSQVKQMFQSAGGKMDQNERSNLINTMMGELQSKGFDRQNVASQAGLSSTDPDQMGSNDLGNIAGFVKDKAPYIFSVVADKMPQIAKYLGVDTSGIMGRLGGMFGGKEKE